MAVNEIMSYGCVSYTLHSVYHVAMTPDISYTFLYNAYKVKQHLHGILGDDILRVVNEYISLLS